MTTENLWGDFPAHESLKSPRKLLQEQADLLSQLTDDHLRGQVKTETGEGRIVHELNIIAPYINNYTITLLNVVHDAIIFPATITLAFSPYKSFICNDSVNLQSALKQLLQTSEVKKVLASLLIQSREV